MSAVDAGKSFFVAKMDNDGNWLWAKRTQDISEKSEFYAMDIDSTGTYISARSRVFSWGSCSWTHDHAELGFVVKIDKDGEDCLCFQPVE